MASPSLSIPILSLMFLSFTTFFFLCEAKEILVGDSKNSWTNPPSADNLIKWAAKTHFQVGDVLVFNYDGKTDSVLDVSNEDYTNCKTSNQTKSFKDGDTKIELKQEGSFYFIGGAQGGCQKGQKVEVTVVSDKHKPAPEPQPSHNHTSPSPSPSPSHSPAPAPAHSGSAGVNGRLGLGLVMVVGAVVGLALI